MRDFFISLAMMAMFGFIIYHFYTDVMIYRNSYTMDLGGVFAEGMENMNMQITMVIIMNNMNKSSDPILIQEQEHEQQRQQC